MCWVNEIPNTREAWAASLKNKGILSFSDAIDEELNEINSLKSCYPHAVACF